MEVYQWVRNILTKEGFGREQKEAEASDRQKGSGTYHYFLDRYHFTYPRNKVRIHFIIAVFCWTGARIGAFSPDRKDDTKRNFQHRMSDDGTVDEEHR